jgi:hypothetical protein
LGSITGDLPTTGHSKLSEVEYEPVVTVLGVTPDPTAFIGFEIYRIEPTITTSDENRIVAFIKLNISELL